MKPFSQSRRLEDMSRFAGAVVALYGSTQAAALTRLYGQISGCTSLVQKSRIGEWWPTLLFWICAGGLTVLATRWFFTEVELLARWCVSRYRAFRKPPNDDEQ